VVQYLFAVHQAKLAHCKQVLNVRRKRRSFARRPFILAHRHRYSVARKRREPWMPLSIACNTVQEPVTDIVKRSRASMAID
jgi:hypothetical protein